MSGARLVATPKLLAVLVALALFPGCAATTPETIAIAQVNGQALTLADAMDTFLTSHMGHGALVRGEPAVRELAGRIIERRLFLAEAEALGIPDDEVVQAAVEAYSMGLAQQAFWRQEIDDKLSVSDDEIEAFYAKTDVAISATIVEVGERALAEALRQRVLDGADMSALAAEHSLDDSAAFDGLLSFVRRGELDPALEAQAFELTEPGSLTPVVPTSEGFSFLRLESRTTNPDRPSRELAIPQIRNILQGRLEDELRASTEQRVKDAAGVQVDTTLLDKPALLGTDQADAVIARSAGETLTLGAFRELLDLEAVAAAEAAQVAEAAGKLAQEWADELALRAAVERAGLLQDPEIIKKAGVFRQDAQLKTLYQDYVYAGIDPDDAAVRAYYDEHVEEGFTRPPEVRLAYIVVATSDEGEALLERARGGEAFEALAREASLDSTSAMHGGRIGWIRPGQLLPEVEELAFGLAPGALAGPVETATGSFVLHVIDRTEAYVVPFAAAAKTARNRLVLELQKQAYAEWVERLKERAEIAILDDGVRAAAEWFDLQAGGQGEMAAPPEPEHSIPSQTPTGSMTP